MPEFEWEDVEAPDVKPIEKDSGIQLQDVSDDEKKEEEKDDGAPKLPDGIRKTVIKYAPPANTEMPRSNDEVILHYEAKLVNGTVVGKSRDAPSDIPEIPDGEPFTFIIDKRPLEVVYGMELAVQTMRKGEIASFTLAPRYAYDELGVPPKIPPHATVIFEIELLDWVSKVDIFGDYRAVKTTVKASRSEVSPGDTMFKEVVLTCKASNRKGEPLEDHQYLRVSHVLGEPEFGPLTRVIDETLKKMVEGEEATVALSYDCIPSDRRFKGGSLDIILHRVFRVEDVSLRADGSVVKKELSKGVGSDSNPTLSQVTLRVDTATDGSSPLPGFVGTRIGFVLGEGSVCDPLECAARKMKRGERAELRCSVPQQCNEKQLGLDMRSVRCEKVIFTLTMETLFAPAKKDENLSSAEKVEAAEKRKAMGAELFKQQRWAMANERYKEVVEMLAKEDGPKEKELRFLCELNQAACLLKLEDMHAAKAICNSVLDKSPDKIKALYRRASANYGLSDYEASVKDLTKLLELDKSCNEARLLLDQIRKRQKQYSKDAKSTAGKMFPGWEKPPEEKKPGPIMRCLDKVAHKLLGDMKPRDDINGIDDPLFNRRNLMVRPDLAFAMHTIRNSRPVPDLSKYDKNDPNAGLVWEPHRPLCEVWCEKCIDRMAPVCEAFCIKWFGCGCGIGKLVSKKSKSSSGV
mmetsp:Transcript_70397/g.129007  ORF Transcript_70397/g.129007 Transcript_70397/m.129007 type:complete len:690 (-) Transcript_70397:18-2087(-)